MQCLGFLHSCIQNQPWANSILIRVMWEDISKAEELNLKWKGLIYGQYTDRKELRELIYPDHITYSQWAIIGGRYDNVFLSINFDSYPKDKRQKFINFVTEVVNFFYLHNKNIIVGAGNETYEKRGQVDKVLQVVSDVVVGVNKTYTNLPICFWNQKIRTADEKYAVESLMKKAVMREFCEYFGFQSLQTTPETARKYLQLAKEKGFKRLDVELGTTTDKPNEIETLVKNDILNGVEGIWILTPEIRNKLRKEYKIWDGYALRILDDEDENFVVVNKYKRRVINYAKQFLEKKEEITDMKLERYYYKDRSARLIKQDKQGYGIRFLRACFGLSDNNVFDDELTTQVKIYQEENFLLIDGKVGPETFGDMIKVVDYHKHYCWIHSLWARDM